MDYTFYTAPPQQFQYGGMDGAQPNLYPGQDGHIVVEETGLFKGLDNIGSSFDAYGQFPPPDPFSAPIQQHRGYPPRQASLSGPLQPAQSTKSISPDSLRDDSILQQLHAGPIRHLSRDASGSKFNGIDQMDQSGSLNQGRSSSEEKDPDSFDAQDKRKAQNRAAQRAFRERKEKHVKELEAKLETLSQASSNLQTDNERLKRELAAISTQNEILRATHAQPPSSASSNPPFQHSEFHGPRLPVPTTGPQSFTPTEFVVALGGSKTWPLKFDVYSGQRGRMLLAGAAWDLIVRDPRVADGKINLEEVCRVLNGKAVCDGRGPAFREDELRQVLDDCELGSDDLL